MITSTDRTTLSKLLALLASNHDGEALAAARKAAQLVKARNVTWPQVLGLSTTPTAPPDHLTEARDLLNRGRGHLTRWEHSFLLGIMSHTTLKAKQVESLEAIRAKVDALDPEL